MDSRLVAQMIGKFGAVLFAALDKVIEQQKVIESAAIDLHEFGNELKASISYHEYM